MTKNYTAVIRTLGIAGEKYQKLLDSLDAQTIKPEAIIVYIAAGYGLPKETIGVEKYVYVPKGMITQRALQYEEVQTEWMMMLDDDLYLPPDFAEKMFDALESEKADVISPDTFPHFADTKKVKWLNALSGRSRERRDDGKWAYKVMRTAGFSYNGNPSKDIYLSQTNAGPCLMCKKETFLKVHMERETWMDEEMKYALGDDQILYYKMYLNGCKILTLFNSGAVHLDAGTSKVSIEREKETIFSDFLFRTVFWKRFIFGKENNMIFKAVDFLCIGYSFAFLILSSLLKGRFDIVRVKLAGIRKGREIIRNKRWE